MPIHAQPKIRIAIIDDNPDVLAALRFAFEAEGYAVDTFERAEAVLDTSDPGKFACLVTDQVLPGMSGLALIRILRDWNLATPAVLITTHPDPDCRRTAAKLGTAIIEKPLVGDSLSSRVRELVNM